APACHRRTNRIREKRLSHGAGRPLFPRLSSPPGIAWNQLLRGRSLVNRLQRKGRQVPSRQWALPDGGKINLDNSPPRRKLDLTMGDSRRLIEIERRIPAVD